MLSVSSEVGSTYSGAAGPFAILSIPVRHRAIQIDSWRADLDLSHIYINLITDCDHQPMGHDEWRSGDLTFSEAFLTLPIGYCRVADHTDKTLVMLDE